ncbi:MAG: hypothetical protein AB7E45_00145 [Candidatus Caldatribacteriota bacterium]
MRKVSNTKKQATTSTKKRTTRKVITGTLNFVIGETQIELELNGKVSASGKTIVFRSSKDDYLENGLGCNIWVDLDLI